MCPAPILYADLHAAGEEVRRRWNDEALRRAVDDYLGTIPPSFTGEPRAALFRNIITPSTELLHFLNLSREIELKPLGIEFTSDKFSTRNTEKMALLKMPLASGRGKDGVVIYMNRKIADIKGNDNRPFCEITSFGNESLEAFHHRLLREYVTESVEVADISKWIKVNGEKAPAYYSKFLALFICHGVLFETFLTSGSEGAFSEQVVAPAVDRVESLFGCLPLVVKNIPNPEDKYWLCYPDDVLS